MRHISLNNIFRDIKILLSSDIEDKSKVMFTRQIQERIEKIRQGIDPDNT